MNQYLNDVQKNKLFNSIYVVLILLAIFLGAKALNAFREGGNIGRGEYPTNVISVNGTGEVLAVPDVASFSFSVLEEGKTMKEAQDKATAKINAMVSAVKALGVEEKDIKTSGYNSYPRYDYKQTQACSVGYCPPGKQVLSGYEVNQTITVKVRKTDSAGDVLTKVGDLGAANISGLDFIVDDMEKVRAEAREKAVEDAKAKAKVLAKTLGVKLETVVNFYENGDIGYPIMYREGAMDSKQMAGNVAMPSVAPQLPTGENKIVSNVTITYEIK